MAAGRNRQPRGFTLMEALMAAAILFAGMLAVMAAIMTGQQNVFEAELQLQATLLAEKEMQDIAQLEYADIGPPAVLADENFDWNGRTVHQSVFIIEIQNEFPALGVTVLGKEITVRLDLLMNPDTGVWRTLAELKAYIPKPPAVASTSATKSALRESD